MLFENTLLTLIMLWNKIFQIKKIKRESCFGFLYGCFLSSIKPTMAIAMIIAIVAPTMYIIRSDVVAKFESALVAVGVAVAAALTHAAPHDTRAP